MLSYSTKYFNSIKSKIKDYLLFYLFYNYNMKIDKYLFNFVNLF
jgi:hypothetical protein